MRVGEMKINELISIMQNLILYRGQVSFVHPEYRKFHDSLTHFIIDNDFENSAEWKNIQPYLLIKGNQVLTNDEANYILQNLEELKRKLLQKERNSARDNCYFEIMHPQIKKVSQEKFLSGYYADSVECAFKEINFRLKSLYKNHKNTELDGKNLMFAIFNSENKNNQRLLAFESLDSESGRNVQEGYMYIFAGAIQAIRNPKAHENMIISKNDAIERLVFASLLMKKIDKALEFSSVKEE